MRMLALAIGGDNRLVCMGLQLMLHLDTRRIWLNSPVPVQFDWSKIRTEMRPFKWLRQKLSMHRKSPKTKIKSNWSYFWLKIEILLNFGYIFPRLFTVSVRAEIV